MFLSQDSAHLVNSTRTAIPVPTDRVTQQLTQNSKHTPYSIILLKNE